MGKEPEDGTGFWVCSSFDGRAASVGNGTMMAFPANNATQVRQFHAAGQHHSGTDEGVPGTRDSYAPDFYVAYPRHPDGNKLSGFFNHYDPAEDPGD